MRDVVGGTLANPFGPDPFPGFGTPDLILQPDREAKISATGDDEYQCFLLPAGQSADRWITAIDFHPGNATVVHSASFEIDRNAKSQMLDLTGQTVGSCGAAAETDLEARRDGRLRRFT